MEYTIEISERPFLLKLDTDGYARILNNLVQNVIVHSHADRIGIVLSEQKGALQSL